MTDKPLMSPQEVAKNTYTLFSAFPSRESVTLETCKFRDKQLKARLLQLKNVIEESAPCGEHDFYILLDELLAELKP